MLVSTEPESVPPEDPVPAEPSDPSEPLPEPPLGTPVPSDPAGTCISSTLLQGSSADRVKLPEARSAYCGAAKRLFWTAKPTVDWISPLPPPAMQLWRTRFRSPIGLPDG